MIGDYPVKVNFIDHYKKIVCGLVSNGVAIYNSESF